ncbi:hypothetical protein PENSPDRAFT_739319 [Peniophora sp. CONT]|nr:hypothetical protein PENSPDRAFT_739319 [Peniophora sp. CONT]
MHGHICATFGSYQTRLFWKRVIGADTVRLYPAVNGNGEQRIMLPHSPQSPAPLYAMPGIEGCWIVDFVPRIHLGPVVPQEPYIPSGTSDQIAPVYQGLRAPIWFIQTNGTVGIPLLDALEGKTNRLWGSQNVVSGTRQNTHFCLKVTLLSSINVAC